ncbi:MULTISPECIES: ogr/Delta-like zinc finger family protein [unclassified Halomonas]|uniref:ogr/Delta-like zinc finger family protein n=1 Tax=unclassified Halomonas TaxID=2609666 RepID=UPI0004BA92DA|nr:MULTISPECIES: ogr/Delta-like zinc finger family protein [unclassified Halomonas]PKH63498.1 transcriptional regulator [Halomonas sp. Choline-3u-9]QGQ69801.1 transcriptional regulator [Halomonas sp. PA16-9]
MSTASKHRMPCPHCSHNMRTRNSEALTLVYREGVMECRNVECNFRGKVGFQLLNTLTPSDMPNPNVDLPFAPRLLQLMKIDLNRLAANDEHYEESADE